MSPAETSDLLEQARTRIFAAVLGRQPLPARDLDDLLEFSERVARIE
jgi:hypothetical protein